MRAILGVHTAFTIFNRWLKFSANTESPQSFEKLGELSKIAEEDEKTTTSTFYNNGRKIYMGNFFAGPVVFIHPELMKPCKK